MLHHPHYSVEISRLSDCCAHLRSEEHTSELQSRPHLVCRLLLEKKKMPEIASRAHVVNLVPVLNEAFKQAGVGLDDIGVIAVTREHGLVVALLVGVQASKSISCS